MTSTRPIAILGAGLSGLSLACALLEAGERRPIVLLDRRSTWGRDRTWCTWATEPLRFSEVADHAWPTWRLRAAGRTATATAPRAPYLHLRSDRLYAAALDRLDASPAVERPGPTVVRAVEPFRGGVRVLTDAGDLEAAAAFDALGPNSPLQTVRTGADVALVQSFLGWEVETERPVFDPQVATLMDFRPHDGHGVRFLYVLPFSPTRALVEDTSVGRDTVAAESRRAVLRDELAVLGAGAYAIHHEEQGRVAMTLAEHPLHPAPHLHAVGAAAGAVRPSSGYAFSRIQRHCTAVATALVNGRPLPDAIAPERLRTLDTIFLHALDAEPERFPDIFVQMAAAVSGDRFARFMTDRSTPLDEARLIAALPKGPFLRGAARAGIHLRRVGVPGVAV